MDEHEEHILLIDEEDQVVGTGEKLAVHRQGLLHRAFSVLIYDRDGLWLLQQRALTKYHSGGLWSNTCCGHPRPHEEVGDAAMRRLYEEMGFSCALSPLGTNRYRTDFDNGLTENELVHVFAGAYDGAVRADPAEAADYAWVEPDVVRSAVEDDPSSYSVWFRKYLREMWPALIEMTQAAR
ncbi:MAG: isopentenyl-diphosphate Delta-isomerase [Hyphomicrobiales bacterium]|nr:isopentenyl-diphosphate Delta-isomerase [Hyphomicrobiales bacterium]